MPESSELIFEISTETVMRLAREGFAALNDEQRASFISDDEYGKSLAEVLVNGKDPATVPDFDYSEFGYEVIPGALSALNKRLAEIHEELIRKRFGDTYMGDIRAGRPDPRHAFSEDYHYVCAVTPEGPRAFSLFSIERYSDEDGDEPTWGIGLTSRYLPAWIDWREPYGGSGGFKLNKEALEMIEEARDAISEVLPEIKDADLVNAPNFY